jgi:Serine aminopeptidase, S33
MIEEKLVRVFSGGIPMQLSRTLLVCGFLAGAALSALPLLGHAQAPAAPAAAPPGKVHFSTVDGVDLHGNYYESSKKNAPAVLIVHAIGEDSRRAEYTALAKALQKEGYAVLTFDLRGHGQSKDVDKDEFWASKYPNRTYVAGYPKESIELRDIKKSYYSVFVNDIAAARAFLDRKNDAGECNTSSLVVIGSESGATLGAIWLNSEWCRFRLLPPAIGVGQPQADLKNPAGKDIICGVWLSITPDLGGRKIPLSTLFFVSGKEKKTPMVFLYNEGNSADKSTAKKLESSIKGIAKKPAAGYEFTAAVGIKGGPKLAGRELLQAAGPDAITSYLQKVVDAKGNEWHEQEFRKNQYIWRTPLGQFIPAKTPADQTLQFNLYSAFIPVR